VGQFVQIDGADEAAQAALSSMAEYATLGTTVVNRW
jgi:hypothetical protein